MTQLLHYELLTNIGAGGMGEVYKARDTRLGRMVALKFLPEAFAQDRERLARFQREAQVLASLNHPNIAALYGFEEAEGKPFLVMELAEGESLDARISRGPIPLDETIGIGLQIALALEEAHDRGVIHRDLKPGNVHVTEDGTVKVLDFGLAKALEAEGPVEGAGTIAQSPTITRMTAAGMILGTAAYMSPEQAKGKSADRRSDVWSFGVVLLEMLSGKRAFEGETVSETLASIMKDTVPLDRLHADTPPALRALLVRCLERDPKRRLQAIGEARIALEALASGGRPAGVGSPVLAPGTGSGLFPGGAPAESAVAVSPGRWVTRWIPWAVAVLGLAIGAVAALRGTRPAALAPEGPLRKFEIETGTFDNVRRRPAVISPDGRRVAYNHGSGIWIRDLRSLQSRPLIETPGRPPGEMPNAPFWSPDSRQVAYNAAGRLWKISADGGSPSAICTIGEGFAGATWLEDDLIVYAVPRGDLLAVSARGGDPEVFMARNLEDDVDFHDPWGLPGGRGVLYALHRKEGVDTIELFADGRRKQLLRVPRTKTNSVQIVNMVCYAPSGHLVYLREQGNRGIWAVPFSLGSLEVTGEPFLVAAYGHEPSVSTDGTLLYVPGREETPRNLVWVNLQGKVEEIIAKELRGLSTPSLAPDGTRVAYAAEENGAGEIWVQDLRDGTRSRLTFTSADESRPVWIPGQNRIAFSTSQEGRSTVSARSADGTGDVEVLVEDGEGPVFTADGKWMIFQRTSETSAGLMRMPMDGSAKPEMLLPGTRSSLYSPCLSPDGRYVSYLSWEQGTATTYLRSFPSGEGKWELPGSWESAIDWLPDRIIYSTDRPEPSLLEIPVSTKGTLTLGTPRKLFDLRPNKILRGTRFAATADGKRFLMVQDTGDRFETDRLVLVENWLSEFH